MIARFRKRHRIDLEALFVETLKLCHAAGLVRVGVVALDGTKVKANAALDANRTAKSLAAEVAAMLAEAEAVDTEEDAWFGDRRGDDLPEGLADRSQRLARLKACQDVSGDVNPRETGDIGSLSGRWSAEARFS